MGGVLSKYHAIRCPCELGGTPHWHDSRKERDRCLTLHLLLERGEILDLQQQVPWELRVNGEKIARYVSDFQYQVVDGDQMRLVVEDVKSPPTMTSTYRLKRALMRACHGVEIQEV